MGFQQLRTTSSKTATIKILGSRGASDQELAVKIENAVREEIQVVLSSLFRHLTVNTEGGF